MFTSTAVSTPRQPSATFSARRYVVPPLTGLVAMAAIFGLLNAQWLIAQGSYRFVHPPQLNYSPSVISTAAPDPTAGPQLIIPKIGVHAPIIFATSDAEWAIQLDLRQGTVHYDHTANPGQNGNSVIFGHSSGLLWAPGNYKFVFTLLNKVTTGDTIILDYNGTRYIYRVSSTHVVPPTDMSILSPTSTPVLTLVTCTPVGTSQNRLVVRAYQVSPVPPAYPTPTTTSQTPITSATTLPY